MKTIVIAGGQSGIGKTTLAKKIAALLPGAAIVKIGHHKPNPAKVIPLFSPGTSFDLICQSVGSVPYLIIESNSILKELTPDCVIYLPSDNPKPSAALAEKKADIIRGNRVSHDAVLCMAGRLKVGSTIVEQMVSNAGAFFDALHSQALTKGSLK